jgi:hypothetical protein
VCVWTLQTAVGDTIVEGGDSGSAILLGNRTTTSWQYFRRASWCEWYISPTRNW